MVQISPAHHVIAPRTTTDLPYRGQFHSPALGTLRAVCFARFCLLDIHRLQSGRIDDACGVQVVVPLPPANGATGSPSVLAINTEMVQALLPQQALYCADLSGRGGR